MVPAALKIVFRSLRRRKFFTFVSLFGIGFTIFVLVVASALGDQVFGPHPPETRLDRTLYVLTTKLSGPRGSSTSFCGYGLLDREARALPGAERVSIFSHPERVRTYIDGRPTSLFVRRVDGEFWSTLDFSFLEGRPFDAQEDHDGTRVAVINATTRRQVFGTRPALGQSIEIAALKFRIVGIVEDVPATRFTSFADVWTPIGALPGETWRRDIQGHFGALIVAPSPKDLPALRAEWEARVVRVALPDPKNFDAFRADVDTYFGAFARFFLDAHGEVGDGPLVRLRLLLAGAAFAFMLLPAINLTNVNLSRILERAPEIGVRRAFGATRRRLLGQFLSESVALTLIGGGLGVGMSALALAIINASGAIPYVRLTVNPRVVAAGVLASLVFGVLSGVIPAWRMSRLHPVEALRGRP